MKLSRILLFFLLLPFFSCNNAESTSTPPTKSGATETKNSAPTNVAYNVDVSELTKDFMTWYQYTYANIRLEQDFIGYDANSKAIDKATFLRRLASGNFIAIRKALKDSVPVYKLLKAAHNEPDIKRTTIQMAQTATTLANMEGKELPEYKFTDLNDDSYDENDTKGKVMLVKCWFIRCVACVEEFPVLNKLVEQYKDRSDIKFVSLASDSKADLVAFLQKKPFSYTVVPKMESYMNDKLKVNAYPLHVLINKEGRIVKATNSIEDMIPFFEKEVE